MGNEGFLSKFCSFLEFRELTQLEECGSRPTKERAAVAFGQGHRFRVP